VAISSRPVALLGAVIALEVAGMGVLAVIGDDDRSPRSAAPPAPAASSTTAAASQERGTEFAPAKAVTQAAAVAPSEVTEAGHLRLPTLQVSAAVTEVGVRSDGALEVPEHPSQVGWWADGAAPGDGRGSVVIDGHVDSARYGPGAFFRLRDLDEGDPIEIVTAAGDRSTYTVTARRQFPKDELPWAEVFSQEGPERLVLVTCGGDFDRTRRSYTDNVVVFAEPV
jgi:sortase (surface protein transpeptidase)